MTSTPTALESPPSPDGERMAVAFCRMLRAAGLRLPPSSTINFVQSLGLVGVESRSSVYWAARATLVHRPEDLELFDRIFAAFWEQETWETVASETIAQDVVLALDLGDEDDDDDESDDEADGPDGDVQEVRFSSVEVLTEKDFAQCTDEEIVELNRLMSAMRFTTHQRRSRRLTPTRSRTGRPDLRRTVKWALRHQGEPVRRAFQQPSSRPRRLVFVLDVSGSMEAYARALIRFAHAAVSARSRVEVFALGTRLTRLTRYLNSRDPDRAMHEALPKVKDWAGGTRLGDGVAEFNSEWAVRGMGRGAVVVVLSDGWDRGDPELLGSEMQRLHRVTHELIWVNPLKATPGYAPLAAGMAASLPHVDRFVEGHSYASLEQLANIIAVE